MFLFLTLFSDSTWPLLTGGLSTSVSVSTVELYGQNCDVPHLPQPLDDHITFLTQSGHLATCGGINRKTFAFNSKCWVLNSENQRWEKGIIGSMNENRVGSTVASLLHGVYVLGGDGSFLSGKSSEFLPAEAEEWQAGPPSPNTLVHHCTVTISDSSFLVIGGQFEGEMVLNERNFCLIIRPTTHMQENNTFYLGMHR